MQRLVTLFLIIGFCLFSQGVSAQNSLIIKTLGVASNQGMVRVALYDKAATFLAFEGVYASAFSQAEKGLTLLRFNNLPDGDYAVALFHDKNDNQAMDKNWLGIPTEPLGFSKAGLRLFGPPKFEDCVFSLRSDQEISITLENNK